MENYLKCSLCKWRCLKWKKTKGGEIVSTPQNAMERLKSHFSNAHSDEYEKLIDVLAKEEEVKINALLKEAHQ